MIDLNEVTWLEPEIREAVIRLVHEEGVPLLFAEAAGDIVQKAILLAINATCRVCLQAPNSQMTAATNNWQIGEEMVEMLSKRRNNG